MHFNEFGPFETVFARGSLSVPGYLPLLNLCGGEVQVVLKRIDGAIDESTNPGRYIRRLLQDVNWRMHLVGAVAILLSRDEESLPVDDLWGAFDAGSWVAPQLAVTAFFSDKEFVQRARARVEARVQSGCLKDCCRLNAILRLAPLENIGVLARLLPHSWL